MSTRSNRIAIRKEVILNYCHKKIMFYKQYPETTLVVMEAQADKTVITEMLENHYESLQCPLSY